jgi:hypothetical protein
MENVGAALGIIIDNTEESVDQIILSDDGTGGGISIPSMLISKKDGLKIINYLATASPEEIA